MRAVGLRVLKNLLSEYVRPAASGGPIVVTDQERVVTELVPLDRGGPMSPEPCGVPVVERSAPIRPWLSRPRAALPAE